MRLPIGERLDEGEQHLELTPSIGGEPSVHLDGHGVHHLAQPPDRGGATLFEPLHHRHRPPPPQPAPRPPSHQPRRDRARHHRAPHRHPQPHPPH
ncbi:unnamed protein product, partial [Musa acuminata subsp. malaccensis]